MKNKNNHKLQTPPLSQLTRVESVHDADARMPLYFHTTSKFKCVHPTRRRRYIRTLATIHECERAFQELATAREIYDHKRPFFYELHRLLQLGYVDKYSDEPHIHHHVSDNGAKYDTFSKVWWRITDQGKQLLYSIMPELAK